MLFLEKGLGGIFRPIRRIVGKPADSLKYALLKSAMERFPERKLFCPMPFKMIEIERGGSTNLCCWLPRSPGNMNGKGIMDIWNSPEAQEIRASILDGTFRYCDLERCPYFASGSLPLQKNITEGPYAEIIRKRITKFDTAKVFLAMDPLCNLRCISCRKDFARLDDAEETEVKRIMESVMEDIPRITALGLSGSGDPFASPLTRNFLFSHDSEKHPHLKLYILTNGLLFNGECWEKMKRGRSAIASVQVSIDAATGETYEKLRLGGSFDTLMRNLRFLSDLRRRGEIGEFIISFVVNAVNLREMKAFATMGFELGCDQIAFSYMSDWLSLDEEEYRELAVHVPSHGEHGVLRDILKDPLFADPRVFLHNLSGLRPGRILGDSMFV
jgi:hypothetical protein